MSIFDILGPIGLGINIAGTVISMGAARRETAAQRKIFGLEQQQDDLRRTAMEIDARRRSMQVLRQTQQAASLSMAAGVQGGAQFGSGVAGGTAQVEAEGGVNQLGIQQNLMAGEQMFDLNRQIGQQRLAYANAAARFGLGQGISAIGGAMMGSGQQLSNLSQQLGGFGSSPGAPMYLGGTTGFYG